MPGDRWTHFLSARHRFHHPAAPSCRLPGHMPVGNRHHMRHPDGGHRIQQPEKLHADGQLHPACLQALRRFFRRPAAVAQRSGLPVRLNNQGLQIRGQIIQQTSELFIAVMAAAKPQPVPAGTHFLRDSRLAPSDSFMLLFSLSLLRRISTSIIRSSAQLIRSSPLTAPTRPMVE